MIAVIGNFGYVTGKLDGQTVKTRLVCQLAKEVTDDVTYYDRQDAMVSKLSLLRMFKLIAKAKKILYLPAYGHLKLIFPFIWLTAKLFRTEIHYIVIGGWLADFIKRLPVHRFMLHRIEGIYCETHIQKNDLEGWYGMKNVKVMYNFRDISFCSTEHHEKGKLKLVFMARITKAKGLDMVFALGDFLLKNNLSDCISIDFYGQIDQKDEVYFNDNIKRYEFINYRGALQPKDIHKTLEKYDAMLFPTNHPGEGLPGTLIDSYIAGIPIIATDWKYAREFIKDGETGIIVPYTNGQDQFNDAVLSLYNNEELLHSMKLNALSASKEFSREKALITLQEILIDK